MKTPRNLILLLMLSAAMFGPGTASAADEPATTTTVPSTSSDSSTDTAPLTLDQDQIDALTAAGDNADQDKSPLEKASDFVTDNAPWFIIGIIVLAAIIAGILIMRGRPRKAKNGGTPKASKSNKSMRDAGGNPADEPAQVPSASELRRRKRAAIQRSREEERLRRKSGIESRKAARRGTGPVPPAAPVAAAGANAVTAAGLAAGSGAIDPVEAEKQSARDQETAAAAMARFETVQAPLVPAPTSQPVPAPVSPSQTAPAAGVVTPDLAPETGVEPYAAPEPESYAAGPEQPAVAEPEQYATPEPIQPVAEAETSILHEPSIENPGPDATVGNAAGAFLAGGAAGAAGGFAAARAAQSGSSDDQAEPAEPLEPVIAPEPGMAPEYAISEPAPVPSAEPVAEDPAAASAEERLRAKVAEIKATQEPAVPAPVEEPEPAAYEPEIPAAESAQESSLTEVERKLSANSEQRDRALKDAEERLQRIEEQAANAERRAAFAERLAQLKVEESEREKRLNEVVSSIDRAEQRAREAEARAEAAERAATAALEQSDLNVPKPAASRPVTPPAAEPEPRSPVDSAPTFSATVDPPSAASPPAPAAPASAPVPEAAPEPPEPKRRELFGGSPSGAPSAPADPDAVNLNSATFEELREAGLSVTQATRILAYRERFGGYSSVDDLEKVPGFPADLIESLKGRIVI